MHGSCWPAGRPPSPPSLGQPQLKTRPQSQRGRPSQPKPGGRMGASGGQGRAGRLRRRRRRLDLRHRPCLCFARPLICGPLSSQPPPPPLFELAETIMIQRPNRRQQQPLARAPPNSICTLPLARNPNTRQPSLRIWPPPCWPAGAAAIFLNIIPPAAPPPADSARGHSRESGFLD